MKFDDDLICCHVTLSCLCFIVMLHAPFADNPVCIFGGINVSDFFRHLLSGEKNSDINILQPGTITKDLWEEINPEPTIDVEKRELFFQQLKIYARNRFFVSLFCKADGGFVNNCPTPIEDGNLYLLDVSQWLEPNAGYVKCEFV